MKFLEDPIHPLDVNGPDGNQYKYIGLTKREHFAAMAMQGMLSNPTLTMPDPKTGFPICYEICYAALHYADRLMEELDKEI